ncbi:MAG: tetratricopeptide repeat protein [Roseiarcus sp.]|jgi:tetratricopeptide (TPR) repeat protein
MTGRPLLVFFCLLGLAAPVRAASASASPPSPPARQAAPQADAGQEAGREALLARLATAADPDEAGGIVARIDRLNQHSGSDTGDLLLSRAAAAIDGENVEVAQQLLDALTALQPQWAEAWAARANADYLAGDSKATFVDLSRALADDPKHLKAMADLGAVLENSGRRDDALRVYQRALEIAPQWRPAREAADRLRAAIAGQDL